jgi:hypothetical protein
VAVLNAADTEHDHLSADPLDIAQHSAHGMRASPKRAAHEWWEHDVFFWNDPISRSGEPVDLGMRAMLTVKGSDGWELVSVIEGRPRTYTFFFNRPAEN